jgi:hypothetical protein
MKRQGLGILIAALVTLGLALGLVGCGGANGQVLTSVTLTPTEATISVGATQQYQAVAFDQHGDAMNPPPVFTWSGGSPDTSGGVGPTVATITPLSNGQAIATGVSAGTTGILATAGPNAVGHNAALTVTE